MRRPVFFITLLLFLLTPAGFTSADGGEKEVVNRLKTAFLLNFAKFTRWPEQVASTEEFRLCLVGTDPLGGAAQDLKGKVVDGRAISIEVLEDFAGFVPCDLVYICSTDAADTTELLAALGGNSRLTVSDRKGFAASGGIIELRIFNNRLGFIINNTRAKEAGLSLKASLLDLALEVL